MYQKQRHNLALYGEEIPNDWCLVIRMKKKVVASNPNIFDYELEYVFLKFVYLLYLPRNSPVPNLTT